MKWSCAWLVAASFAFGCDPPAPPVALPAVLDSGSEFDLLSLDPNGDGADS